MVKEGMGFIRWYGVAWDGTQSFGNLFDCMILYGVVWNGRRCYSMVWYGMV